MRFKSVEEDANVEFGKRQNQRIAVQEAANVQN
jgi:hypothetical protein